MAYGLKYELLCTSKISKIAYSLQLFFDGYESSQIDRNMPASSPLVLRKDAAAVIHGTSLEFAIREEVDFEFDEFYTNSPKKIKVVLNDANSQPLWYGYVLPQQYQATYKPSPNTVRFVAADGLGLLKEVSFALTGRASQLDIIRHCVANAGLDISYSIAVNFFEPEHDTSRTTFEQTFEDVEIYTGKNCYEVLEAILGKYDAEITQSNAQWRITASDSKESERMLYTFEGVYDGTASAPDVLTLGKRATGDVYPVGALTRSMEPGAKKVTLSHDYGRKKSLLSNYDFSQFVSDEFTDWIKTGAFTLYQRIDEGKMCAFLPGYTSVNTQKIEQGIEVVNVPGEVFVFEIDFAPVGNHYLAVFQGFIPIQMTVRMVVAVQIGSVNYFLSVNKNEKCAFWTTTPTFIEETVTAGLNQPVWNHWKAVTDGLPGDGTLFVSLYRCYIGTPVNIDTTIFGIWFSEPLVYFTQNGQLYPSGVKMTATFDNSTEPGDLGEIEILVADAPDLPNNFLLYKNITRLSDGTPTK